MGGTHLSMPVYSGNMQILLVVCSYHHGNTEKIARAMATVLGAEVRTPAEIDPGELPGYHLVGFGGGIYSARHHPRLLEFARRLPLSEGKHAFIFSTSALVGKDKVEKDHRALRGILKGKGYVIIDEFACKGWNTNSFLRFFGGMNKGRPNAGDIDAAREFAKRLTGKVGDSQSRK